MTHTIFSQCLKEEYKLKPGYFTRERKQTFIDLVLFILNMVKKSLQIEINGFNKLLSQIKGLPSHIFTITKSAFVQNRQKLSPGIFKHLLVVLNKEFYTDNPGNIKLWKGFRLLSIDGSRITLPITEELKGKYGEHKNQNDTGIVQGRCSIMYDVLNKMVLDGLLAPKDTGERELALQHLRYCNKNDLIIYDRGYPSFDFIYEHEQLHLNYLIRCKLSFSENIKKFVKSRKATEVINIKPGKNTPLKNKLYDKSSIIKVRLVRVELDTGETEILMTSLLDMEKYPNKIFKTLYFKRWKVETYYDILKNKLQIENFTGYLEITIQQDFNAIMFISNLQSLIIKEVEEEIGKKYSGRRYQYKVNNNLSFGFMKNRVIELFLTKKPEMVLKELKKLFIDNVEPIRPGRKNKRDVDKYRTRKKPIILKNFKNAI